MDIYVEASIEPHEVLGGLGLRNPGAYGWSCRVRVEQQVGKPRVVFVRGRVDRLSARDALLRAIEEAV